MLGIYEDSFISYLNDFFGADRVKVKSKGLIIPCPFCGEYDQKKNHYHLNISTEAPIFHCFYAGCNKSGNISKLLTKLEGRDTSDKFVDKTKIKELQSKNIKLSVPVERKKLILPDLREDSFKLKSLYLKSRLRFSAPELKSIKGLIFDIDKFINDNQLKIDNTPVGKLRDYFHSNFIGFLTENESLVIFRNIDEKSDFRYFKFFISETRFLDYYKLYGNNSLTNHVIIAEGIFDIFNEKLFNFTGLANQTKLYAAALSTSYDSLIKSIVFDNQIFRLNVSILSDKGIDLNYYKKIKNFNKHVIDKMTIFYNKIGKDFGESNVLIEKFIL